MSNLLALVRRLVGTAPHGEDQRVTIQGAAWESYLELDVARGVDVSTPRLSYLDGNVLEIVMPGRLHWLKTSRLRRLVDAYCDELSISAEGVGSWTLRSHELRIALEPDESYILGADRFQSAGVPDIAIEVVMGDGIIRPMQDAMLRLATYRRLGVPEVWFYQGGMLTLWAWAQRGADVGQYLRVSSSHFIPGLDTRLVERCMGLKSSLEAVKTLRSAIRFAAGREAAERGELESWDPDTLMDELTQDAQDDGFYTQAWAEGFDPALVKRIVPPENLSWIKHLPDDARTEFREALERCPVGERAQLIREWRNTAEIYADPELLKRLSEPVEDE